MSALAAILPLAQEATAAGEAEFRHAMLWPDLPLPLRLVDAPEAGPIQHRHARRIWAASQARPLRITLVRRARRERIAGSRRGERAQVQLASRRPFVESQAVLLKLTARPVPQRPALVTIYQDRTLRTGDAVMMADGIHIFHGTGHWPHPPREFVRLTFVAALNWRLRQTFNVLDRNPPTRWTSLSSTAG